LSCQLRLDHTPGLGQAKKLTPLFSLTFGPLRMVISGLMQAGGNALPEVALC